MYSRWNSLKQKIYEMAKYPNGFDFQFDKRRREQKR